MNIQKLQPDNIVSLQFNKQKCVQTRQDFKRIISHLEGLETLTDKERTDLHIAKTSLLTLNDCESTIDKHLIKFLS